MIKMKVKQSKGIVVIAGRNFEIQQYLKEHSEFNDWISFNSSAYLHKDTLILMDWRYMIYE